MPGPVVTATLAAPGEPLPSNSASARRCSAFSDRAPSSFRYWSTVCRPVVSRRSNGVSTAVRAALLRPRAASAPGAAVRRAGRVHDRGGQRGRGRFAAHDDRLRWPSAARSALPRWCVRHVDPAFRDRRRSSIRIRGVSMAVPCALAVTLPVPRRFARGRACRARPRGRNRRA
jgi:hypothetical protein